MITKENKVKAFALTQAHKTDVGSSAAQASVLTSRINEVTEHLKANKHDNMARRGLMQMVGRRKKVKEERGCVGGVHSGDALEEFPGPVEIFTIQVAGGRFENEKGLTVRVCREEDLVEALSSVYLYKRFLVFVEEAGEQIVGLV